MDPNNSGFIVEDELNESDFTTVSSIGEMDMKQIIYKIQKLEDMAKKNAKDTNNLDQLGMMQIGWQMGEKFSKMEIKMDGICKKNSEMKDGMAKMMKELEGLKVENKELKEENGRKLREIAELIAQFASKNAELAEKVVEKDSKIEKLKVVNERLKKAMTKLKDGIDGKNAVLEGKIAAEFDGQVVRLEAKIVEKDSKNEKLEAKFNELKNLIGITNAELEGKIAGLLKEEEEKLKEMMAEMQGQIGEMAKLTEQLGGVEWIKYDSNEYKLSSAHCGPRLTISEGGLVVKHSSPYSAFNLNATNKSTIAFYFEMKVLNQYGYYIGIGFCGQQFPLEYSCLGNGNNSIGIWEKGGMMIDGTFNKFGNAFEYFEEGDFVGLGIIHKPDSKKECFATWNGNFLGKVELPSKFVNLPLFPAISLYCEEDSIRANFNKESFQFKEFGGVLQ